MTLLEGHQVLGFVIRFSVDPAAMQDADPLEGEGAQRGLMRATPFAVALVKGFGPERARYGLAHPLDEGLALEGGAREMPVGLVLLSGLRRWIPSRGANRGAPLTRFRDAAPRGAGARGGAAELAGRSLTDPGAALCIRPGNRVPDGEYLGG